MPRGQARALLGPMGMKSLQAWRGSLGEPCLRVPGLRDGAKHCFSKALRIDELTFENCLGDELEVLSITIPCGSLKITLLKCSDK